MRSGTWDGATTTDNLRVIVGGVTVPAHKATISSAMHDGHPAAVSTSTRCVTATIEWVDPTADVTASAPHPFTAGWLPKPGAYVIVQTGDAATGQWWTQHVGVIDVTTGSIADGTATSRTVDRIDDLNQYMNIAAVTARHVPIENTATAYREVGLTSTYMIDRMLRSATIATLDTPGWYCTPTSPFHAVASVPANGSLWPETGTVTSARRVDSISQGPVWATTEYGRAPVHYLAAYTFTTSTQAPTLSLGLHTTGSGAGRIDVIDGTGRGVFLGHDRDTDEVTYGPVIDGVPYTTWRLPRQGALRAALHFERTGTASQTLTVRLQDGRTDTRAMTFSGWTAGWAADRAVVDGRAGIGWWIVEGDTLPAAQRWFVLDFPQTARIRPGVLQPWTASRDMPWVDPATWLREQVAAECAAMWLDEDGVMQWAGRGVLEAQSPAQTVTSHLDVDDVTWESRRSALAKRVWMQFLEPSQRVMLGGPRITVHATDSIDLGPGETEVAVVPIPDDEDWIGVDYNSALMGPTTTPAQLRVGSKHGGTRYTDDDAESGQVWDLYVGYSVVRAWLRALKITVSTLPAMPAGQRYKSAIPVLTDKLESWHNRAPAIIVRAKSVVTWLAGEKTIAAGSVGQARYDHSVGWRVQGDDMLSDLLLWIRDVVSASRPTITGAVLAHDPRRQVGDVIKIRDEHVTGMWWDLLITERTTDTEAFTDTLGGRLTAWGEINGLSMPVPAGPTVHTPVTDWTREKVD